MRRTCFTAILVVVAGALGACAQRTNDEASRPKSVSNLATATHANASSDQANSLGVCAARRVAFQETDPVVGEFSGDEIQKGASHVVFVAHGQATLGTNEGSPPDTGSIASDREGKPIEERSVWVIVQDGLKVPASSAGQGGAPIPTLKPGETPAKGGTQISQVTTPAPDASIVYFTAQAWVRDAKTGEQLQGWTCASEERQPDGTWLETRGVDPEDQSTRSKSQP